MSRSSSTKSTFILRAQAGLRDRVSRLYQRDGFSLVFLVDRGATELNVSSSVRLKISVS